MAPQQPPLSEQQAPATSTRGTRGFQYSRLAAPRETQPAASSPEAESRSFAHQPKGRTLTTLALLSVIGLATFAVWNSFFRYAAFGVVAADIVNVSATTGGTVMLTHAREGEEVEKGQLVVSLRNLDAEHRLEQIGDELQIARASLAAKLATIGWQMQEQASATGEMTAEYHEAAAEVERHTALQQAAESRLRRARNLQQRNAISDSELEQIVFEHAGQTEKLAQLREALRSRRMRAESAVMDPEFSNQQLAPLQARVDSLQREIERMRATVKQGEVRSPASGKIVRMHIREGELAEATDPLFAVAKAGSMHVQLYLPQRSVDRFAVGDVVDVRIRPHSDECVFTVDRVGSELQRPPAELQRFYPPDEKLLPLRLVPKRASLDRVHLPIGSRVSLASDWFSLIPLANSASRNASP